MSEPPAPETEAPGIDQHLARVRRQLDRLSPHRAHAEAAAGARLVDTRPRLRREDEGGIPGALVIERNHLEWRLDPSSEGALPEADDRTLRWIVFCDEGYASSLAAASLRTVGVSRATDLIGGFRAWRAAGLPVLPPTGRPGA
ncbi:rhodanese-like domain-containing protein [Streptomyces bohaiensis]|uniref:Sulfurtransferase n=1 Tax=Streptomyces bohaiensis TaxID=1431344 RepID=A0ABX1C8Y0_9ACTN|nr:rhodanese-like domain-containing protein [Streptomyces bohaiensis]NJQ15601.1 sulfurtransferase [Streptomyces bohaiensis]